jgi:hypothetical protein
MRPNLGQLLFLSFATVCSTGSPAQAEKFCGFNSVSPQQLEIAVAAKVKDAPNLSDPEYQTYFDRSAAVAWAFTTPKNRAHPAAICRMITQDGKDVVVTLRVKCGGTKSACDAMAATWDELNERMKRDLKRQ